MARPSRGSIQLRERSGGRTAFIARFSYRGVRQAVTVGTDDEITRDDAEAELRQILRKIDAGTWEPPRKEADDALKRSRTVRDATDAYFRECQSKGLIENTLKEYAWRISYIDYHLGTVPIRELTRENIIDFRQGRLAAGLSAKSVNSFIQTLAAALEGEVDQGNVPRNVARGKNLTVRSNNKALGRPFMDYDQVEALLDAADQLEAAAREANRTGRRYLIATIWLAGLRVTEACNLTWGDWDRTAGTLRVSKSKTTAGVREVIVLDRLHRELTQWRKVCPDKSHDAPMFPNARGGHRNKDNVARRVLNSRLREAAENIYRERHGQQAKPFPEDVSAHDGRRTYASWALEAGHNPALVQRQLGHTDPQMTLRIYARVENRKPDPRIEQTMAIPDWRTRS